MRYLLLYAGSHDYTVDNGMGGVITESVPLHTQSNDNAIIIWLIVLIIGALITTSSTDDSDKGVNRFLNFCCIYVAAFFIWWIAKIV